MLRSGELLVVPPVTVEQPPQVDINATNKLMSIARTHGRDIDMLLDDSELREKKISDFANILYTYVNSKVDTGLANIGADFQQWLASSKVSTVKQAKIIQHISDNLTGWQALWTLVAGIMNVKNGIIAQLDKSSSIKATTAGQEGGEGYVIADPQGDIKLVNRSGFTAANRAVQR